MKKKLSAEEFSKAENDVKNNIDKKYELIINGSKNAKIDDNVLMFLKFDYRNGKYCPIGSSINGLFYWNSKDSTFHRVNDEDTNKMEISLKELERKIRNTKDISQ